MKIEPVFLLSQPRAGSTLVQRVLGAYDEVATVNEPWILLPLLSPLRESGIHAHYPQYLAHTAILDFAQSLPRGMDTLREELAETALRLYAAAAPGGTRYFLDKTPAYHVIAELLLDVFPDARFIYLWRNPLSILASLIDTWSKDHFVPHIFRVDLFNAVENLVGAYERGQGRVLGVRYEDLVGSGSAEEWHRLTDYVDLEWDPTALTRFSERRLAGRMGDPTGVERYQSLSDEPLEKWRAVLNNPVRRAWARRYLEWIGEDRLAVMGYDLAALEHDLDAAPSSRRGSLSDIRALAPSLVTEPLRQRAFKDADGRNAWQLLYRGSSLTAAVPPRPHATIPPSV
jgi:hypothetical protein